MKNIFESPEVMSAYAQIDLLYYGLEELSKQFLGEVKNQSPINQMIDEKTGFAKAKREEVRDSAIECLELIIEQKKIVEADYSEDEK